MIQPQTMLTVADNTGAKLAQCIRVLGGTRHRYARLGDVIVVTVKKAAPRGTVPRRSVQRAVIVRTRVLTRRRDGSGIRFDDNACVIVGKDNLPKGTRVFGPVARELKGRGFQKVMSLAPDVL